MFPPLPAQILLNLENLQKKWCLQLFKFYFFVCPNLVGFRGLKFSSFACANMVEFTEIATEVMLTMIQNLHPLPAQNLLYLKKLQKKRCLQWLKFSPFACPNFDVFREIAKEVMLTRTSFSPFADPGNWTPEKQVEELQLALICH